MCYLSLIYKTGKKISRIFIKVDLVVPLMMDRDQLQRSQIHFYTVCHLGVSCIWAGICFSLSLYIWSASKNSCCDLTWQTTCVFLVNSVGDFGWGNLKARYLKVRNWAWLEMLKGQVKWNAISKWNLKPRNPTLLIFLIRQRNIITFWKVLCANKILFNLGTPDTFTAVWPYILLHHQTTTTTNTVKLAWMGTATPSVSP